MGCHERLNISFWYVHGQRWFCYCCILPVNEIEIFTSIEVQLRILELAESGRFFQLCLRVWCKPNSRMLCLSSLIIANNRFSGCPEHQLRCSSGSMMSNNSLVRWRESWIVRKRCLAELNCAKKMPRTIITRRMHSDAETTWKHKRWAAYLCYAQYAVLWLF